MLGEKLIGYTNYKFVLFDGETEGLNTLFNRPWQIAWMTGDKFNDYKFFNRFPHWFDLKVSKGAAYVTGFDMQDYLSKATDAKEVFKEFLEYILDEKYWLIGHNIIPFDSGWLVTFANQLGFNISYKDFQYRMIDTFALARALKIGISYSPSEDPKELFAWQVRALEHPERPRGLTLEGLAKEFEIDISGGKLHDAEHDIKINAKIARELIKRVKI